MGQSLELLQKILACPKCHASLELLEVSGQAEGFACNGCALVYPLLDGIPDMLVEDAIKRSDWDAGDRGRANGNQN